MKNKDPNAHELETLFEDLYHPNPNINYKSCKDLILFWPNESQEKLIQNLGVKDVVIRRKTVKALSEFGLEILPRIIDLFSVTDDQVVKISCFKIFITLAREIKTDQIPLGLYNIIEESLKDENPQITLSLICLLRELREGGVHFLKHLSKDNDVLRSKAAVTALSEINEPSISSFLRELIADSSIDDLTRKAAIDGLNM